MPPRLLYGSLRPLSTAGPSYYLPRADSRCNLRSHVHHLEASTDKFHLLLATLSMLVLSLAAFTVGVAITLVAAGLSYLSNCRWMEAYQIDGPGAEGPIWRKSRRLNRWAVSFATMGVLLFMTGMALGAVGF